MLWKPFSSCKLNSRNILNYCRGETISLTIILIVLHSSKPVIVSFFLFKLEIVHNIWLTANQILLLLVFRAFNMKDWERNGPHSTTMGLNLTFRKQTEWRSWDERIWGVENFQLVIRPLIGLLTLWCQAVHIKSSFLLLCFIMCQQTCQEKAAGVKPEVLRGTVSIKRLTQVLIVT